MLFDLGYPRFNFLRILFFFFASVISNFFALPFDYSSIILQVILAIHTR